MLDELLQVGDAPRGREARLVEPRLEAVFERHHELDALERAQPSSSSVVPRSRLCLARTAPTSASSESALRRLERTLARRHPVGDRAPFQLRVPSVPRRSPAGQTDAARMRW